MMAALLYRDYFHHLDHLAPLCSLLKIPLITTDNEIYSLSLKFYPDLKLVYLKESEICHYFLENIRFLISCLTRPYLKMIFFPYDNFFDKKIFSIWCPHGNSDKGLNSSFFDPLKNEQCLLVYGEKMLDIFKGKKILTSKLEIIEVGNYRKQYYDKYRSNYQSIIKNKISLRSNCKKYLYAPTWEDFENNSSMPLYLKDIKKALKVKEHLFIKLHPNTLKKDEFFSNRHFWDMKSDPQITFLNDFPSIYPILDNIDAFLGDFSSIGYDMLSFNKPMGFLLSDAKRINDSDLFKCGMNFSDFLTKKYFFKDLFKNQTKYENLRTNLYKYTYAKNLNWKNEILNLCQLQL